MISLLAALFISHAQAATWIEATCGDYTLTMPNDIPRVEYKGAFYPSTDVDCSQFEDQVTDVYCTSTLVPEGKLEVTRKIVWFDHRDRVDTDVTSAKLSTASGISQIECK